MKKENPDKESEGPRNAQRGLSTTRGDSPDEESVSPRTQCIENAEADASPKN
jgi:hypothetical protein